MRKVFWWATVLAGVGAAYLMLRRGAPLGEVAGKTLENPVGTLVDEVKAAV
jgi:hypothetical protein